MGGLLTTKERHTVKKSLILALGGLVATGCFAQEAGRVLSSTPVMQQVAVPRQVCSTEQVEVQQPKSGAGAALGAIAGGAMGNAVGRGAGQAAATMLGIVGGAIVGDRIEGAPPTQLQSVQRCAVQTQLENRPVGYNVVYEYAGRQYTVQMPNDPGPTIALQVSPVGAGATSYPQQAAVVAAPPVVIQQPPVVLAQPAYPVYYPRLYYPPVQFNLGFGHWDGHHGGHHWR